MGLPPYYYPDVGNKAPPGVRQAIRRFRREPLSLRSRIPLLYYLLGSGTPPYKMSAEESAYVPMTNSRRRCGNCQYAYQHVGTGRFICSQIAGDIRLEGTCRLWKKVIG